MEKLSFFNKQLTNRQVLVRSSQIQTRKKKKQQPFLLFESWYFLKRNNQRDSQIMDNYDYHIPTQKGHRESRYLTGEAIWDIHLRTMNSTPLPMK